MPSIRRTHVIADQPREAEANLEGLDSRPSAVRLLAGSGFVVCTFPLLELQRRKLVLTRVMVPLELYERNYVFQV